MPKEGFDLVILGSGSAAFAAAIKASELGARVAMTENGTIGGTCVNVGCIPSKNLIEAAREYYSQSHISFKGIGCRNGDLDLASLIRQKDRLVSHLRNKKYIHIARNDPNISIIKGRARFLSKTEVEVGNRVIEAPKFIIATGARSCIPLFLGIDKVRYITSREAFKLKKPPRSMIIIGGGFISLELGQMFHRLGTNVTILERGPHVLRGFDEEAARSIQNILMDEGISIYINSPVEGVEQKGKETMITASVNKKRRRFTSEELLIACGRVPNTEGIGHEDVEVEKDQRGFIKVDMEMKTTADSIWAAGDVTGPPQATPIGAREGVIAAENAITDRHLKMDYSVIPRAVFTDPEVASVGLTAEEARAKGLKVAADCLDLNHVPKAAAIYKTKGLVKMVIEEETKRILGVHLVADRGADIIHEAALAIKCQLTTRDLIEMIHVYPTMSEAIRMAAQMFTKDVSRLSCCAE
mgnify:CR=1 FL=1